MLKRLAERLRIARAALLPTSKIALKLDHAALEAQVRELSRRSKEMELFGQLTEMLQTCANPAELGAVISAYAKDLFPNGSGALYLMQADPLTLVLNAVWGESPPLLPKAFPREDCWSMRRGKPHYQGTLQRSLFCSHVTAPFPSSTFCLALAGPESSLGLLHLRTGADSPPLTEALQLVAIALAHQAALGLSNIKLKEILREEAIRDPVTGLFNRRFMQESLNHEIQRAQRNKTNVGVISFDLDHFKSVNDSLGHAAGDALLQGLAKLITAGLRAEDISCRQGGDEFLIILPDITEKDALALAEGLRQQTSQFSRAQFPSLEDPVSLSAGVALFPQDASSRESLQKAADEALYRAKALGRDRIFAASGLKNRSSPAPLAIKEVAP